MGLDIGKITDYIFLEPQPQRADLALVFGARHQEVGLTKKIERLSLN
jgi:hypothetical protein